MAVDMAEERGAHRAQSKFGRSNASLLAASESERQRTAGARSRITMSVLPSSTMSATIARTTIGSHEIWSRNAWRTTYSCWELLLRRAPAA